MVTLKDQKGEKMGYRILVTSWHEGPKREKKEMAKYRKSYKNKSGAPQNRTGHTRIFSPLLYHLS